MSDYTLKDKIVQDSLVKISQLNSVSQDALYIVVGGIAIQSYAQYPELYRPTNDIDILVTKNIVPSDFKTGVGKEISDYLTNQGYQNKQKKIHYGYEIIASEKNSELFIHLSKFSDVYLDRNRNWKYREFSNAKEISPAELGGCPLLVHRIEDIIANKSKRLRSLETIGFVNDVDLSEWQSLQNEEFESLGSANLRSKLKMIEEKEID